MWDAERSGAVPVTFHPRSTPVIGHIPGTERGNAFRVPPPFHPRGTHPFFYSEPSILDRVSVCAGAAAERYEVAVKDLKCEAAGLLVVPMVVEVFGTWGALQRRRRRFRGLCEQRERDRCGGWSLHSSELVRHSAAAQRPHSPHPSGPCHRDLWGACVSPVGARHGAF
jgi:hypothetical protein